MPKYLFFLKLSHVSVAAKFHHSSVTSSARKYWRSFNPLTLSDCQIKAGNHRKLQKTELRLKQLPCVFQPDCFINCRFSLSLAVRLGVPSPVLCLSLFELQPFRGSEFISCCLRVNFLKQSFSVCHSQPPSDPFHLPLSSGVADVSGVSFLPPAPLFFFAPISLSRCVRPPPFNIYQLRLPV